MRETANIAESGGRRGQDTAAGRIPRDYKPTPRRHAGRGRTDARAKVASRKTVSELSAQIPPVIDRASIVASAGAVGASMSAAAAISPSRPKAAVPASADPAARAKHAARPVPKHPAPPERTLARTGAGSIALSREMEAFAFAHTIMSIRPVESVPASANALVVREKPSNPLKRAWNAFLDFIMPGRDRR